jgi:hypothetical protein
MTQERSKNIHVMTQHGTPNAKHNTTSSSSVIMFALGQSELRPINTPPWMDGARIWHFFPLVSCF